MQRKTNLKKIILLLLLALLQPKIVFGYSQLNNPTGQDDFPALVNSTITYLLGYVGVLVMIYFFFGAWQWFTARGDSGKVDKGKKAMYWAVLGLFAVLASYAMLNYVFNALL